MKSENVVWHLTAISREDRSALHGHRSMILWFTGLSGAGKSTLANAMEARLHEQGCSSIVLDGDNVRHGLCGDLGFTEDDRIENIFLTPDLGEQPPQLADPEHREGVRRVGTENSGQELASLLKLVTEALVLRAHRECGQDHPEGDDDRRYEGDEATPQTEPHMISVPGFTGRGPPRRAAGAS